jgi:hypothetical protein
MAKPSLEQDAQLAALAELTNTEGLDEEDELLEEGAADGSVDAPTITIVVGGRGK